jgi:aminocarboxymuconate-semialdehyde decarboxylase
MCADDQSKGDAADPADDHATAIDVHAHAMPLPLLEWLEHRSLADLSRADDGIVVLDPSVSGVGKDAPLPLARSQYDPGTRVEEMDSAGVAVHAVSMPPSCTARTHRTGN